MARNDYTKAERDVWQAQRLAAERARGQHSAGINALPRVNAQQFTTPKVDGTTRFFDEKSGKWLTLSQQVAKTGVVPTAIPMKRQPGAEKKVSKEINAAIREKIWGEVKKVQPTRDEMAAAAKAGKSLHALMPSTCLQSLTWKADGDGSGVATAEFYRGGAVIYDYPMDLDEFIDWAESGSLGKYGNENWF
jgi:hypothetical protein